MTDIDDLSKHNVDVYNKIARQYTETFDDDTNDDGYQDKFLSLVKTGKKVLDLGCGTGRVSAYFHQKGYDVIGIDLSEGMLKIAKEKYPGIDFRLGDIRDIKLEENSFDGVSIAYVLFYLEKKDINKVLKKVNKLLKDGGPMLVVFQEGEGEIWVDEPLMPGEKLFVSLYKEEEIIDLLQRSGFEIIETNRRNYNFERGELPYNKLTIIAVKKS